jgi:hypothetical protein
MEDASGGGYAQDSNPKQAENASRENRGKSSDASQGECLDCLRKSCAKTMESQHFRQQCLSQ